MFLRGQESGKNEKEKKGKADGEIEQGSEWRGAKERNKMQMKEKQRISLVVLTIK